MNLKDPKIQKIMLGVMTMIILSYVYFGTSLLPINYPVRKARIEALNKEYTKLSAELEKARKMVGNLARLEAEYERLHDQWLSAQELLPEEKEMPDLLRKVTTAGNKAGIQFALFEPQSAVPQEFYTEHPVKVKVRGGYHQVAIFFSQLANMPRIVNVTKLEVESFAMGKGAAAQKQGGRSAKKFHTVEAEFFLSAYTLLGGIANEDVQVD